LRLPTYGEDPTDGLQQYIHVTDEFQLILVERLATSPEWNTQSPSNSNTNPAPFKLGYEATPLWWTGTL
jgi:hypothetical protein